MMAHMPGLQIAGTAGVATVEPKLVSEEDLSLPPPLSPGRKAHLRGGMATDSAAWTATSPLGKAGWSRLGELVTLASVCEGVDLAALCNMTES